MAENSPKKISENNGMSPDLRCAPAVMGILNVTPDSFSDGGSYPTVNAAVEAAKNMYEEGASIIDVGGESTRPGYTAVSDEEEIARTAPVVARLTAEGIPVSIDTRHPRVAQAAVDAGAEILNDVEGFRNPEMIKIAAASGCTCIVMSDAASVEEILAFWDTQTQKLLSAGVANEHIIVDPGFGFGKDAQQNAQLMRDLSHLVHKSAFPVLVGISRKRWIGKMAGIIDAPERDAATLGADLYAARAGAAYLRVHNVKDTVSGLATYCPLVATSSRRALIALGSEVGAKAVEQNGEARVAENSEGGRKGKHAIGAAVNNKTQTNASVNPSAGSSFDPAAFAGKSFDELQYSSSLTFLKGALKEIDALPFTSVTKTSSIYVSEGALGVKNPVLNAVIEVETSLLPFALLQNLLQIETTLGRGRPNPRTIDLDLLWVEGYEQHTPTLTLPHPGMGQRQFVLRPLAEVIGPPCHFLKNSGIVLAPKEERIGPIIKKLSVPLG